MSLYIYPPTPVSVTTPPTGILVDGVETPINWDTTTPANTIPMPSLMHYMENGQLEAVNYDGIVDANTRAIPMKLVGADGTNVTIQVTTGDINVQLTHTGSNPDSTQVGNGTTIWQVEAVTGKGLVKDQSAIDELVLIKGLVDPSTSGQATEAKQDDVITALGLAAKEAKQDTLITASAALLAELDKKADLTEIQPVSMASLPLPSGSATEAKQDDQITALGLITKPSDTQPISAAALPLPTGAATEATLSAQSAKFPATLGSKADAASLSVTQSTEDKAIQNDIKTAVEAISTASENTTEDHYKRDFNTTPLTVVASWVTLRTLTANIRRVSITNNSGNELLIRNQATAKTIIVGQGASVSTSLVGAIADVIQISAITADATEGIVYLNFEG